jgi:tricorn protease interacting factor F2/3
LRLGGIEAVELVEYDLFIDLDFTRLKFRGKLLIRLRSEEDVVLNSVGLQIERVSSDRGGLQFSQKDEDLTIETGPFDGTLQIDYAGAVLNSLAGIYSAPYDHTHIVSTHFEAAQARRMLPCVDRPDAKAVFKLAVKIDNTLDAISNMPVQTVTPDGDKKIVTFEKTPRMSTYLLYLGVGKFETQTEKVGSTEVIVATTPGKTKFAKFAQDEAKQAIEYFNSYYGLPYSLPKVHLIGVPEFAMGAMENWGAITFREVMLLIGANTSTRVRRRSSMGVAHELAHQWFGDLVTMKWWDDIWLNESFATLMSYKALDSIHPDWMVFFDFLNGEPRVETLAGALGRDSLRNTHPIQVRVKSPDEIEQIFDAISYGKGAHVLRMIEGYVGEEAFREGVSRYLSKHAYSNATGNDLWSMLEVVSKKPVKQIMSHWVTEPGYPIVTVSMLDGQLILRQERFLLSGDRESATWPIPVVVEVNGLRKRLLMEKAEEIVDAKDLKSLKVNPDSTGFFLVKYEGLEEVLWMSELSPFDKWGIIFDAFLFLLSRRIDFKEYLSVLGKFSREAGILPAGEVSNQLMLLYSLVPSKLAETVKEFHRTQLKLLEDKTDENSRILRGKIASQLALVDRDYASKLGKEFRDYARVHPDMKQAVALAYARATNDVDGLLKAYRETDSDEDKLSFLNAMTGFADQALVRKTLSFATSGEVKRQDVIAVVGYAAGKPYTGDTLWSWLQSNIETIRDLYLNTGVLSGVLGNLIPILGVGRIQEVEGFFEKHKMPEAEMGIKFGLEKLRVYDRLVNSIMQT